MKENRIPRSAVGPPLWVRIALRVLVPEHEREFFLGDLQESRRRSWFGEVLGTAALRFGHARWRESSPSNTNGPKHNHHRPRKGNLMLLELFQDLRFGLRMMIRNPSFTLVALITLALGIGANTAVYSLVHGVILEPLPYPHPDRIAFLMENNLERGWQSIGLNPANYLDWKERNSSLELFSVYQDGRSVTFTGGDQPLSLEAQFVREDFLQILGGEPFLGRGITAADVEADAEPVVVLTHGCWRRVFGEETSVLDRTMTLNGQVHTVVGVLPEHWRGVQTEGDVILPMTPEPWWPRRDSHYLPGIGRLKPGVTLEQAQDDFSSIAAALGDEHPETNAGFGAMVSPLKEVIVGSAGSQLYIFMASVGLVLLIACANVANMTLSRATRRNRELAIRNAIGAGRARVVRQLLAESLLLAILGGTLGVALAYTALQVFVAGWPEMLPRLQDVALNTPIVLFTFGISLGTGVIVGFVPALSVARSSLATTIRQGSWSVTGDRSHRWTRATLIVGEVCLAVVLLITTGLLTRSFGALKGEDPGFEREGRLVVATHLPLAQYPWDRVRAFGNAVVDGMETLPGVESAALTSLIPLGGESQAWPYWLGSTPGTDESDGTAIVYRVSPEYHETMAIPILAGRHLSSNDIAGGPWVVVVSESFAELNYPGESAVGKRVRWRRAEDSPLVEIVGVVGDVQHSSLGTEATPQAYLAFPQRPSLDIHFVLQASVPPLSLVPAVRDVILSVDPNQPTVEIREAETMVLNSISAPRFRALLMSGFGFTALLLAAVGLYGVISYSVSQRSKEIGVRVALGATEASVLRLVFREGVPLLGFGLVSGLAGAFALTRILESMLFGVGALDPGVFVSAPLVLLAVATLAILVPAWQAARVDPVKALVEE